MYKEVRKQRTEINKYKNTKEILVRKQNANNMDKITVKLSIVLAAA